MTSTTDSVLAHHLRSLDPAARERLVAELWAERGFEVARDGGVLVASTPTRTERVHVGPSRNSPAEVDVVVDGTKREDGEGSVHVVDATDLAEMLRYGLDPAASRALCERYLGAPPTRLPPPLGTRLGRRIDETRAAMPAILVAGFLLIAATIAATSPPINGGATTAAVDGPVIEGAENRSGVTTETAGVGIPPASYPTPPPGGYLNGSLDMANTSIVGHVSGPALRIT